jgi:hypothetical protein
MISLQENWCTIAPVKYRDPFQYLHTSFRFSRGVVLDTIPAWLRQPKFMDNLGFVQKDFINRARYALFVMYKAKDLETPDPNWRGKETRSIQDANHEAINMANVAIWLSNPCAFGFDVIFHIDDFQSTKNLRSLQHVRDLESHLKYHKTYLHQNDLKLAKQLHARMFTVPRNSAVWIGLYTLWNALREPEWATRYTLFWIGLEALFGPEDAKEITFRISQRIGFFLGKNRSNALDIFQRTKKLYAWRSKVVHGLRLAKLKDEESIEVSYDTEILLKNSLVKILKSQKLLQNFAASREKFLDSLPFK